jgi:NAD-dependent dihydropyrimidine dehydrogenase PreA subunit
MPDANSDDKLVPKINYDKCTGQGVCVEVCPEDIFEIRNISQIEFCEDTKTSGVCPEPKYSPKDRKSYPVNIDNCTACEICVEKCPEKAIILISKNCLE